MLDLKAKLLILSVLSATGAPLLAAWNGDSSWHVAIGIAAGAIWTGLITYFTPGKNSTNPA